MGDYVAKQDIESRFKPVKPIDATQKEIEEFAVKVRNHYRFVPGKLVDLIEELGNNKVRSFIDPEDLSGAIEVRGHKDFTVYISEFTGPLRDQFTMAHELGHYFLHSEQGDIPIRTLRSGSNFAETQANWFAASFLMPEELVRNEWKSCNGNLSLLSANFFVSPTAMKVRCQSLGLC